MMRKGLFAVVATLLCGVASAMKVGDVAPDLERADLSGRQVQLAGHRGKLVLLNFWASWCEPCREEMPAFSRWQTTWQANGLQVIGVSMDDSSDDVRAFLAAHPVTFPVVMGDAQLAKSFGGVLGLPLSYLIDGQGRVIARYQGEASLKTMEAKVRELLNVPDKAAEKRSR
jgi:peroxiredoxin